MATYYNENDPKAAAWLRVLIEQGVLEAGDIDERSIEDVRPADLRGYRRCHFFAGIGGWAEALRLARWPADREVWTGSCPCQPFSQAGEGNGTDDERHLWPSWFYLIEQCRPSVIFGEQVDAAVRHGWLDLVSSDLEGIGYAIAPPVLPAACVGAPQGRHRLFFVADADGGIASTQRLQRSWEQRQLAKNSSAVQLGDSGGTRSRGDAGAVPCQEGGTERRLRYLADELESAGAVGGFWRNADWIYCTDHKYRPVEPGTFPLAHGVPARLGRLRGYGNAIVPELAAEFIRAYMSATN